MLIHLRNLKSYLLIILASIGVGMIIAHPLAPQLVSDCVLNQINDTYIPGQTINEQLDTCFMRSQIISVATTILAAFLFALWFRRRLLNEVPIKQLVISSLVYGLLQFLSLIFLQSHYLYDAQQAFTFGEIARNYWFAIDTIVYYLIAVTITSLLLAKHNQRAVESSRTSKI